MLDKLKELLNDNKLDLYCIKKQIDAIGGLNYCQEEYLKDLLDPINRKNVKIPSKNPVPSVAFQMKTCSNLTLDENGEAFVSVCPFFLCDDSFDGKMFSYSTFDEQEGYKWYNFICKTLSASYRFEPRPVDEIKDTFSINMGVEEEIYIKYRLVSAALKISYIGSVGSSSGTISGAVSLKVDKDMPLYPYGRVRGPVFPPTTDFLYLASDIKKPDDIEYMSYLTNYKVSRCLDGLTMLYYPVDNSYYQFYDLITRNDIYFRNETFKDSYDNMVLPVLYGNKDKCRSGFKWLIHIEDGQPLAKCIKFEMYCNFECIPSPKVLNYMPVSINTCFLTEDMIRDIINKVKEYIDKNNIYIKIKI